jgi:hypothetical protein
MSTFPLTGGSNSNVLTASALAGINPQQLLFGNSGLTNNPSLNGILSTFQTAALTGFSPDTFNSGLFASSNLRGGLGGSNSLFSTPPSNSSTIPNPLIGPGGTSALFTNPPTVGGTPNPLGGSSLFTNPPISTIPNPLGGTTSIPGAVNLANPNPVTGLAGTPNPLSRLAFLGSPPAGTDSLSQLLPLLLQLLTSLGPGLAGTVKPPVAAPAPEDPEIADLKQQIADLKQQLKDDKNTQNSPPPPPKTDNSPPPPPPPPVDSAADASSTLKVVGDNGKFINDARGGLGYGGDYNQGITVADLKIWIAKGVGGQDKKIAQALITMADKQGLGDNWRFDVRQLNDLTGNTTTTTPAPPPPPPPAMDASYIRKSDFDSKFGNDDFNSFVNEIKTLSGTSALYITKDNLVAAKAKETDPDKQAIIQNVIDNFSNVDGTKHSTNQDGNAGNGTDGLIGAGDLQLWYN